MTMKSATQAIAERLADPSGDWREFLDQAKLIESDLRAVGALVPPGVTDEMIADLVYRLNRAHRMSCSDPNDPSRKTMYSEARDAINTLLALHSSR